MEIFGKLRFLEEEIFGKLIFLKKGDFRKIEIFEFKMSNFRVR